MLCMSGGTRVNVWLAFGYPKTKMSVLGDLLPETKLLRTAHFRSEPVICAVQALP